MIFQRTGFSFTFPSASLSRASLLYGWVDDNLDEFERVYDDRFPDNHISLVNIPSASRMADVNRRRIIHFNVTAHPTARWSGQQLRNAFGEEITPRFLIRDRDAKLGELFTGAVSALGLEPILTACRSPWQWEIAKELSGAFGGNARVV